MNHTAIRLKGDEMVNSALNNKIARESEDRKTKSIAVKCQNTFEKAVSHNCVGGEIPSFPDEKWSKEKQKFTEDMKESVKAIVRVEHESDNSEHLKTLLKQGEFLKLIEAEQNDPTWKSFIYGLKKGTMKFLLNSLIHTLPTQTNLMLWNKATSNKCLICKNQETTLHILNGCKTALDQGRYTWRHDSILNYMSSTFDKSKFQVFSDIPGQKTENGGTIPSFLTVTADRPDIVVLDKAKKAVYILELTAPFESNISTRHTYKTNKYAYLLKDISDYKPTVIAYEVGSRGHISKENRDRLKIIFKLCEKGITFKNFVDNISKISITSSFYIYNCRKNPQWTPVPYMKPN